jgi:tetratricopeptide (TPR) repeat protein
LLVWPPTLYHALGRAMTESASLSSTSAPIAELERRLQWRVSPLVAFLVILIGLGAVATASLITKPATLSGLPDDPDSHMAVQLTRGRLLPQSGELRFRSTLTGEGAIGGASMSLDPARASKAEEMVTRARLHHTRDPRVVAALASLDLVRGHYENAERRYRAVLERNPSYGEARLGLGTTLALRARTEGNPLRERALQLRAIAQFAAVPASDPGHDAALYDRAILLGKVGRHAEATRVARTYLERDPRSQWAARLRELGLAAQR